MIAIIFVFCIVCFFVFGSIRTVIHEYAHALAARIVGEKVIKVHIFWFKTSFVELENEPVNEEAAKYASKHMAFIAISGFATTNLIGYLLCPFYYLVRYNTDNIFVILLAFTAIATFLLSDSAYFATGSVIGEGDVIGFRACLHIPKWLSRIIFIPYFALNCFVIIYIYISTLL